MVETLMLNKGAIPIEVIDWKRAISLCYVLKTAFPLVEYEDKIVHSSTREYHIPSVIQLLDSDHQPKRFVKSLPFNRKNLYIRDGGRCMYCGKSISLSSFTFDHVIPQSLGGKTNWMNVVVCCIKCNSKKGGKRLEKSGLQLIREPYIPQLDKAAPASIVNKIGIDIQEESWEDFIYWNVILVD